MELRNIKTFIRVAELGSFTKAANEMGYVQSAATMQIKQLEKELGFPLFDRIGKKFALTIMGTEFLNRAYRIVQTMEEAANLGKNLSELHGILRVGILESLLFSNMINLLPEFKEHYKNLDLRLKIGQASELIQQLKENKLDLVYLSSNLISDPDLLCCYKRLEQLIFISSPDHDVAKNKKVTAQELFKHDFVVTERSGVCYGRLTELAQRYNTELNSSIEMDSTIAITSFLQKNKGIAFLPEYSVRKSIEDGSVYKVDVDIEPQTYYSQILSYKNRWFSPYAEKIIEGIKTLYPDSK